LSIRFQEIQEQHYYFLQNLFQEHIEQNNLQKAIQNKESETWEEIHKIELIFFEQQKSTLRSQLNVIQTHIEDSILKRFENFRERLHKFTSQTKSLENKGDLILKSLMLKSVVPEAQELKRLQQHENKQLDEHLQQDEELLQRLQKKRRDVILGRQECGSSVRVIQRYQSDLAQILMEKVIYYIEKVTERDKSFEVELLEDMVKWNKKVMPDSFLAQFDVNKKWNMKDIFNAEARCQYEFMEQMQKLEQEKKRVKDTKEEMYKIVEECRDMPGLYELFGIMITNLRGAYEEDEEVETKFQ